MKILLFFFFFPEKGNKSRDFRFSALLFTVKLKAILEYLNEINSINNKTRNPTVVHGITQHRIISVGKER